MRRSFSSLTASPGMLGIHVLKIHTHKKVGANGGQVGTPDALSGALHPPGGGLGFGWESNPDFPHGNLPLIHQHPHSSYNQ